MKKINTILKKEEFTEIIKKRRFISQGGIAFYYREKKQQNPRVGITVTNKLGNAVERNKAKRQLRELIDEIFTFSEEFDTIIIIREKFSSISFEENRKHLEKCYKQVKI